MTILSSFRVQRELWRSRAQDRDERRGFSIDKKRVVIAYAVECVIVAASLWGAWLFANFYGHNDWRQMQMMMLAPIGYAVIEFCRVPLAISMRSHGSWFVRFAALLGVLCASGVTVKSMSQLGEIMFRPRLFDVVHATEALQQVQAARTTLVQQIAAADGVVASTRAAFDEVEQRAKSDAAQLASLPKDQCQKASGTTRDGRAWSGQTCKADARIGPLRDNLKTTVAARDDLERKVEAAVAVRAKLDLTQADKTVAAAWAVQREAILNSQLHSFAGMLFGVASTDVTDQQIHQFLRIFVFFPAIFVAFASTFVAFTAVHRVQPKLIPLDTDGFDYLLNPLYKKVLEDAVQRVTETHQRDAQAIGAKL